MKVKSKILGMSYTGTSYSLVLEDLTDNRVKLPIFITDKCAMDMYAYNSGEDLMLDNLLINSNVNLTEIYIEDVKMGVFECEVKLDNNNSFKASVSESLLLATITKCDIYVKDKVFQSCGIKLNDDQSIDNSDIVYNSEDLEEEKTSLEELQEQLKAAEEEEDFAKCVELRDIINSLK